MYKLIITEKPPDTEEIPILSDLIEDIPFIHHALKRDKPFDRMQMIRIIQFSAILLTVH